MPQIAPEPPQLVIPDLAGKRVLITGASTGIGAELAEAFAEQGARVAIHYAHSEDAAWEVAGAIGRIGGEPHVVQGDLTKGQYQAAIRLLARMCAKPIAFTIDAITAEGDRVVAEARSTATLINGEAYANTYVFPMRIREGRIAWIGEHMNALIGREQLYPVMALLA